MAAALDQNAVDSLRQRICFLSGFFPGSSWEQFCRWVFTLPRGPVRGGQGGEEFTMMILHVISFSAAISACEKGGQWQHAWHAWPEMCRKILHLD
eukprot:5324238-Karenia_brevis.AAC.1